MQGTKSSSVWNYDHSYLIIVMSRCSGNNCASDSEVTDWLTGKKVFMRLIDNKIDMSSGAAEFRQYERWLPTVDMTKFSDTGYRYRKNFYKAGSDYTEVFDYAYLYNHDEFIQEENQGGLIGEFYFRWADEQIMHQVSMQFPEEVCALNEVISNGLGIGSDSGGLAPYVSMVTLGSIALFQSMM